MSFSRIEVIELEVEGGKPAGGAGLRGEAA